jgi:DNA-binding IclR family transcriptional regulator
MSTRTSETVGKALAILDCLTAHGTALGTGEIATLTRIHKSTVARLCATLETRGYLRRRAPRGAYTLGAKAMEMARTYARQFDLEALVRPVIVRLRDETGESVSYYVVDGDARLCLFRENSQHAIRHYVEEGARLPFTAGVVGHVLLAFAGAEGESYDTIRADGYLDDTGREPYTASVAAPVVAAHGGLAGAIVISGPSSRFTAVQRRAARRALLAACAALAGELPGAATARARPRAAAQRGAQDEPR